MSRQNIDSTIYGAILLARPKLLLGLNTSIKAKGDIRDIVWVSVGLGVRYAITGHIRSLQRPSIA